MESKVQTVDQLRAELEEARRQLHEANETIEAIRTGQVDALVVQSGDEHQLFTLSTADHAYRVFIEKMTEGAVTLNRSGLVLYANSQFATMAAVPLSEVMGHYFESLLTEESRHLYGELFAACWEGDCKGEVYLYGGGTPRPVQLSLTPLELEEGTTLSIIVTDLTLQKAAQQQLEENYLELAGLNRHLESSNHDLQQFASVASHDLQEPLRKIQMFADLFRHRWAERFGEQDVEQMDKVILSARRMKALINDVLNYSRLSSNDGGFVPTDLNELIDEVLEDYELTIREKGARIERQPLPQMEVNRGQIRQAFQNLISNALKFSRPGEAPLIRITARRLADRTPGAAEMEGGPWCAITVADNGIGFDEKYSAHILSLFERLHPKEQYEGTGIGLSITNKIVEKHGGVLLVQSREGEGSAFTLLLPVMQ